MTRVLQWAAIAALAALFGWLMAKNTYARDLGQWDNQPPAVREWYRNAQLTDAARARLGFANCCDHSDVVRTQFRVSKSAGAQDQWWYLNGDVWKQVPPDIIHWNEHAPGGEPVLFAYQGIETCFYPPDGGI